MARNPATQKQVDAANPKVSTWLSANAGSGKTRVLTDRVARLLLNRVPPQNILCLTYTKAAASEMQNRLFKRLGEWSMKNDRDLVGALKELGVDGVNDAQKLAHARTLFATALETPGGLKIQTIHSFCASLLRRFPLEAGVSPFFKEIEDRAAKILRDDVVESLSDGPDASVVLGLAAYYTSDDLANFTGEIVKHREILSVPMTQTEIWDQFELKPDFDETQLLAMVFTGAEKSLFQKLVPLLFVGGKTDQAAAQKLSSVDFEVPGLQELSVLVNVLLFASGNKAHAAKIGSFPTKAIRLANPDISAELEALMLRVEMAREILHRLRSAQKTYALRKFARAFLAGYKSQKLFRGWLDFDDLILLARSLLTDPAVAQWVLFRLDGGIDHILVDEAQDTSPRQWDVIRLLAQEFTAGQGARSDIERTIFVVGDLKQSIYSFQGADPKAFDAMREHFNTHLCDLGKTLNQRSLEHSFRSSPAILKLVDYVFEQSPGCGVGENPSHQAFSDSMPGRVDLWPLIQKSEDPEEREWYDPTDKIAANDHRIILAENIADEISRLMISGSVPDDCGGFRKIHAGDFLILVQRRSELFHEIIRACKLRNLPIAGADRLRISAELAVKDITSLMAFLAMPDDDLSLASALRSPLFGWDEATLYDFAHTRHEIRLWPALLRRRTEIRETFEIISDLRNQADFLGPYELIERILTRHGGRDRLLARLGPEAEDGIDALISQALSYERTETPSLTGFITWLETDDVEIKRQTDSAGDRIRVMTTHGAKGLEAPIVILPDTATRQIRISDEIIKTGDNALIWKSAAEMQSGLEVAAIDQLKSAQEDERMRLLYVALTRAEKWLIVCGSGDAGKEGGSWYKQVEAGMNAAGANLTDHPTGQILRLQHGIWQPATSPDKDSKSLKRKDIPDWALSHAPSPVKQPKSLSPSELGGAKVLLGEPFEDAETNATALEKGRLLHLLLEHLPAHPRSDWDSVAGTLVSGAGAPSDRISTSQIIHEARNVLENKALSHVFAPETLAEVAFTANLPDLGGERVHGVIDRLVIGPDRILCVDFKSNTVVPATAHDVPAGLLRQMAAYAAALAQIYPDRIIETAILWTRNATLMHLPHDIVRSALTNPATS